jgi:hypothetical protein
VIIVSEMNDSTDRICKCSEHYEVEMQTNGDCIKFVCAECKRDADEVAADAKRAEAKDDMARDTK